MEALKRLFYEEEGPTAVEYALTISIIVVLVVGTAMAFKGPLTNMWQNLGNRLAKMVK